MTGATDRLIGLLLASALLSAAWCGGGCAQPDAGPDRWLQLGDEPERQDAPDAELFHSLIVQPKYVNQNQAYHAFIVWMEGADDSRNFGKRIVRLQEGGVLSPQWVHEPLAPLTRGRLASMICRKLDIRTSVALALVGPVERAARRELIFRNIMLPGGGDGDSMSGAEFVNVLKRADEYRGEQGVAPPDESRVE